MKKLFSSLFSRVGPNRPRLWWSALFCSLLLLGAGFSLTRAPRAGAAAQGADRVEALIELDDLPAVEVYAQAKAGDSAVATRPGQAARETRALQAARAHLARIEQAQQTLLKALSGANIEVTVINRLQKVFNGITVQVEAGKLDELRKLPGVKAVHPVTTMELTSNAAVPFVGAPTAWTTGVGARGEGIKVGIIDTGIDYLHTNFGGPGGGYATNNRTVVGDAPNFPGVKVAGGYDFVGDDYDASSSDPAKHIPHPDPDPMDCAGNIVLGHGTGVASLVAGYGVNADGSTYSGPYNTTTPFSSLKVSPGVAPSATLYALKVFGCGGKVADTIVAQAIEWAVDPNGDGDFSDHLDVINLSLGTIFALPDDPAVIAADNAALAGVIVAAGTGNSGDTHYQTAGPASAARAISVAGSRDSGLSFPGLQVNSPASIAGKYQAAAAEFGPPLGAAGITNNLVAATPADGCAALTNPAAVNGMIALIDRGTCNNTTKVRNAQAAGARAVIVVNNVAGLPTAPSDDGTGSDITIPSLMISQSDGATIKANLPSPGVSVTLSSSIVIQRPDLADTLTDFTSLGPRIGDSMLKPDITAPGEAITVAQSGRGTGADLASGTSYATPIVAGALTLLRQVHPNWSVEELKALIMNTATFDLFSGPNSTPPRYGPARVGAGRLAIQNAVAASVVAYNADDPGFVSVSFGVVEVVGTATLTKNIRVVNKGAATVTYNLTYDGVTDIPGVSYSFPGGTSITVPAGGSTTFQVRLEANAALMKHTRDATLSALIQGVAPRQWLSEKSGYIKLTPASGPGLRVPVYATARPASAMGTTQTRLDLTSDTGSLDLNLTGQGVNTGSAYPTDITSLVSVFELQEVSPDDATSTGFNNMADLKYVGVNSNFSAQGSVANTTIYFGLATHGAWSTPTPFVVQFQIFIDSNLDGVNDYRLVIDVVLNSQGAASDVFITSLQNLATNRLQPESFLNGYPASQLDTSPYNTNVVFLPVRAVDLGLTEANAKFSYQIKTTFTDFKAGDIVQVDASQRLSYDVKRPGLSVGSIYFDLSGTTIPVQYNRANFQANASRGVLLLHHHNAAGNHEQALLTANCPTVSNLNPTSGLVGSNVVITGTNFVGTSGVRFSNNVPAAFTVNSDTQITAAVPAGAASGPITISKATCADVQTASFTVAVACPTVNSRSPASGSVGSSVTITGVNFIGVTAVKFANNVMAQFTVNSDTSITTTVPAGASVGPITLSKTGCPDVQTASFTPCSPITITPAALPAGTIGAAYNQNLTASGGTAPYSFAVSAGSLPNGLTLSTAGMLSGTPTQQGSFNITVRATGANGCTGTRDYMLVLNCPTITLAPASLPNGITGTAYNQTVTASPAGNYNYSITAGALPAGLSLNSTTGAITGTPTTAGTANFTITATSSGACSGSQAYTLIINNPAPAIASLNPTVATAGSDALMLTVTGSNFVNGSTVRWNGADRPTTFVSATQLTAQIPATDLVTAGTASVTVFTPTPGGGISGALTFTVNNPTPTTIGLNPTSAVAGGPGFTLTVSGTKFVNGSVVRWNGGDRPTTFVSSTQLTAAITASDISSAQLTAAITASNFDIAGTASVTVFNPAPGGGTSNAQTFTLNNPVPTLAALNPSSIIAGSAAFTLTLTGTNFVSASVVRWNGSNRPTTFVSSTQLTATIPASDVTTAGTANVSVFNPAPGGGTANTQTFTINNPPPTIAQLNPGSATAGGAGFTLTVTGSNFVNGSVIRWNGNDRATTFVSSTQLSATIPASDSAAAGTANVGVFNPTPGGGTSAALSFTINNPAPTLAGLNPNSAAAGGAAFTLSVTGTNFVSGALVRWNGTDRPTTFVSATQLTAAIPASDLATAGTANVGVFNPTPGGGASNAVSFTVNNLAPSITSLDPSTRAAGGAGFTLTVNGTNFVNDSFVRWNGSNRATTFVSTTRLTAAIPAADIAATGTARVTVVNPAPGGGSSNEMTVTIAGALASVSAASFLGAELAAESIVSAFGVGLATSVAIADTTPLPTTLAGTRVLVRDSAGVERPAPLFFVAPSQINYLIPPGTAAGTATITVTSGNGALSVGTAQIAPVAPGLFTANANGQGVPAAVVFRLKADGAQSTEPLAQFDATSGRFVAAPIDVGPEGEQVFLILFGTGLRGASSLTNATARIGGSGAEVLFVGAQGLAGLDQVNLRIPRSLAGRGEVDVILTVDGKMANTVRINIK